MKFIPIFCLLIVSIISVNGFEDDQSPEIEMIQALATSVMSNHRIRKRAIEKAIEYVKPHLPSFNPMTVTGRTGASALAAVTLYGTFKLAVVFLAGFYCITTFFPAFFGLFGFPAIARTTSNSIDQNKSLNYIDAIVSRSLDTMKRKTFFLDLEENSCKDRAICEVGSYIKSRFPTVAYWVDGLGAFDKLIAGDQFTLAMMKGMRNDSACAQAYPKCAKSPFSTWSQIANKFK